MSIASTIASLKDRDLAKQLKHLQKGIEKESLRIDANGMLAMTPHPQSLGSPLTHPRITTDYSEALLEIVTPVYSDHHKLLHELTSLHAFIYQNIGSEKLWVNSMPCLVKDESQIPIAGYGSSNSAKMRETYRIGLGHRYGRLMQIISGIHFNFSLAESYWEQLANENGESLQETKTQNYLSLIRNFHRHAWLIIYLLGASPAVCKGFIRNKSHRLEEFDMHSLYAPYATSLRLSDLGYSNHCQSRVDVNYNHLSEFIEGLRQATTTSVPEYEKIGVQINGQYRQLNSNILQVENEFYSVVRPKPKLRPMQRPVAALAESGIEYIEVRCLDLNPWLANGIDEDTIRFLECFLLFCQLQDSPELTKEDWKILRSARLEVCYRGRDPNLLFKVDGIEANCQKHGMAILNQLVEIALLLDELHSSNAYSLAINKQIKHLTYPELLPSSRILQYMQENQSSFYEFAMHQAETFEDYFKSQKIDPKLNAELEAQAKISLQNLHEIENNDTLNFEQYLEQYYNQ